MTLNRKIKLFTIILGLLAAVAPVGSSSAAEYPSKPLTLMIGYKAGGGTDAIGRVIAKVLTRELGQQVKVINKPGAGGGIAAMSLKKSKPDGYTMMVTATTTFAFGPHLNKKLKYTVDDFSYAGILVDFQPGFVASSKAPYNNMKEFIAYAKANPGVKYASFSPGTKMIMELVAKREKLDIKYVPVKGGAGMVNLLLGGNIDVAFSGGIHARFPDKMKLIGASSSARHAKNSHVPTFQESGIAFSGNMMGILVLPKNTPRAAVKRLEAALKSASLDPDVKKLTGKMSFPIVFRGAEQTTKEMHTQWNEYGNLVKETGFQAK